MRPVVDSGFHPALPIALAVFGGAGGAFLARATTLPTGLIVATAGALAAVLFARAARPGVECSSCGKREALEPKEEAEQRETERQQLRGQLRAELSVELRPVIEQELRPPLEQRLRTEVESELRPRLAEELRPRIAEALRPELERELRGPIAESLRASLAAEVRDDVARETETRLRAEYEEKLRAIVERMRASQAAATAAPPARPPAAATAPQSPAAIEAAGSAREVRREPSVPTPAARPAGPAHTPLSSTDPHARAQRRARVIVSDVLLYHRALVEEAAQAADWKAALGPIWDEAVHSYRESLPQEVRATNYLDQAFDAQLEKMRRG